VRKLNRSHNYEYLVHRGHAKRRGIDFLLSYEEWFQIWQESGHLHERGYRKGQYCMARFGDVGPYVVGNVHIILHADNSREGHTEENANKRIAATKEANARRVYKKFKLTEEQKAKISKGLKGKRKSAEHIRKHAESLRGFKHSEETKKKMSISKVGHGGYERTKEQKLCQSENMKERWRTGVYDSLRKKVEIK
jgi:hypothetical protein